MSAYDTDFFKWTQEQAEYLKNRRPECVDWLNVAEEIESLGISTRNQIENRMVVLIKHLLKWRYQDEKRTNSWRNTIFEQRRMIAKLVRQSPSLNAWFHTILEECYEDAKRKALYETGLLRLPEKCPYSLEQIMREELERL